jgi:oligopeptide transport system permease protein
MHLLGRTLIRFGLEIVSLVLLVVVLTTMVSIPRNTHWEPVQQGAEVSYQLVLDVEQFKANFTGFFDKVAQGDLGVSQFGQKRVSDLVLEGAARSLTVLFVGLFFALVLGVIKGIFDFRRLNRKGFGLGPFMTALSQGLPDFWLVLLLQWGVILSVRALDWRPFVIYYDPDHPVSSMMLPLLVMIIIPLGFIARVTANALTEIEGADFIRTARAKGLHEWRVQLKHALRPVAGRIIDALPGVLSMMLSNLAIVEYLTGFQGLVRYLLWAIQPPQGNRPDVQTDVAVVVVSGLVLALVFIIMYEVLRWLKGRFDPRLREGAAR